MKLSEKMREYETGEMDKWADEVAQLEADVRCSRIENEALKDGVQEIREHAGTAWSLTNMTHPLSNILHTIMKSCDALLNRRG